MKLFSAAMIAVCALLASTSGAAEVNTSPSGFQITRAYPQLRLRRPVVITNAADGSQRLFVASQQGVIQILPSEQSAKTTKTFLDIEKKVVYVDKQNEEGLLGMAFHPKYKDNGEFFVYYTTTDKPHTSVVSRFRVSKDNPDVADPNSEEELLRIAQPFWNHNGGTLAFGPDGYLYIALGDGGKADDPFGNGQNLKTLLGSILRIDIDNKGKTTPYAIPQDNPFVGRKDARPEIFAYGVRNPWRLSFDRQTGTGWIADVGQKLWEEIDILVAGGNYGWNLREATHKFGPEGSEARDDLIDPIWEYHHNTGKSITGGSVYRGKKLPGLVGQYLYGDYVSGKFWALEVDADKKKTVANRPIHSSIDGIPVITFGEDEAGEVYFGDAFGRLFQFEKK
jgi:glucose/arabinose dehydrogenase